LAPRKIWTVVPGPSSVLFDTAAAPGPEGPPHPYAANVYAPHDASVQVHALPDASTAMESPEGTAAEEAGVEVVSVKYSVVARAPAMHKNRRTAHRTLMARGGTGFC